MAEDAAVIEMETESDSAATRIYEAGYQISPAVKEEEIEKVVSGARSIIEKAGGSFIAEGAPVSQKLAYPMSVRIGEKRMEYDRGYFGWLKFESTSEAAQALEVSLTSDTNFLRSIVFRTVREDTRAKYKAPQLREVKRTDTLKTTARRVEEVSAPLSEERLEKAIEDITAE